MYMYDKDIKILNDVGNQSSAVQSIIDNYASLYEPVSTNKSDEYTAAKNAYDELYKSYTSIKDISGNVITSFTEKNSFFYSLRDIYSYNKNDWDHKDWWKIKIDKSDRKGMITAKSDITIYDLLYDLYNHLDDEIKRWKGKDTGKYFDRVSKQSKIKEQYLASKEKKDSIVSTYNARKNLITSFTKANTEYLTAKRTSFDSLKTLLLGKFDTYGSYISTSNKKKGEIHNLSVPAPIDVDNISTLTADIGTINAIDASFNSYWLNNCDSDKSAIDASGWEKCGLNRIYSSFQTASDPNKKISNDIIGTLTEEQKQSDRFKKAKEVDDAINTKYNYDYFDAANQELVGDYTISKQNHGDIITDISNNTTYIKNSYNNCDDIYNSLNSYNSDNKPFCLVNEYNDADATCKNAISKSEFYNYTAGTTKLNDFWSSVDNSIPGNFISTNENTLAGAKSKCNTWINMFNKWEAAEEEAIANPCSSERPIQSANDPVILKITEEWSKSATSYIEKLMRRLEIIQIYIQKYPNILELEAKDVRFGPSSIGASMILRMDKNQTMGVAPVQYLEMLIPNGDKGETGVKGEKGIPGDPGLTGTRGKVGKTGDPTISSRLV